MAVATVVVGVVFAAAPAWAAGGMGGATKKGGVRLSGYDRSELRAIAQSIAADSAKTAPPKFEYAYVANCGSNTPAHESGDDMCTEAAAFCEGNTPEQGLGPSVRLFRRPLDARGNPVGPWERFGTTCFPDEAPGTPSRPVLTMERIVKAFHDTDFAKPRVEIQPKGNVTLVRF